MKPSISHLRVLFCPCVVHKANAYVGTMKLNMCHQAQKGFCGLFFVIPQLQKGYLIYVPQKGNIVSSYDVVFDNIFSSALTYKS